MLLYIAIAIVGLVAALLIRAALLSPSFRIARTQEVHASPDKIYNALTDFQQWKRWSPYEQKDPDMKRLYSGAATGKGAIYAWDGDKNIGAGRMEILSAEPKKIDIQLDFFKPFKAQNFAEFTLEPNGSSTRVTWAMHGHSQFLCRLISTFVSMDKMVGKDFEAGLKNLKEVAESA
jgi:uncharacterized protein YndB with AHSA1/START domain